VFLPRRSRRRSWSPARRGARTSQGCGADRRGQSARLCGRGRAGAVLVTALEPFMVPAGRRWSYGSYPRTEFRDRSASSHRSAAPPSHAGLAASLRRHGAGPGGLPGAARRLARRANAGRWCPGGALRLLSRRCPRPGNA
jgi:hypothetical protein